MKSAILQVFLMFFPWKIRKWFLKRIINIEIEEGARIGFSIILAHKTHMGINAKIGNLCICKAIDELYLDDNSKIGTKNYITGFSVKDPLVIKHRHFAHVADRKCVLRIGKHTAVTSRHYFDCNGGIYIGDFCEVAGFETAFMTHSIDIKENRQNAGPIVIGDYTFIGARCLFLLNSTIPPHSIVGANSMINKKFTDEYMLYGGSPARPIKDVSDYKFFKREVGFVE